MHIGGYNSVSFWTANSMTFHNRSLFLERKGIWYTSSAFCALLTWGSPDTKALSHMDHKLHVRYIGLALLRNLSHGCSLIGAQENRTCFLSQQGPKTFEVAIPDPLPRERVGSGAETNIAVFVFCMPHPFQLYTVSVCTYH